MCLSGLCLVHCQLLHLKVFVSGLLMKLCATTLTNLDLVQYVIHFGLQ